MCAFRARRSQRSFPLSSLPVKGTTGACSPDETESNTVSSSESHQQQGQQQQSSQLVPRHIEWSSSSSPTTIESTNGQQVQSVVKALPAVVVGEINQLPSKQKTEETQLPIFRPCKIQCFLDPNFFKQPHESMTKNVRAQYGKQFTDIDEKDDNNNNNNKDENNNNNNMCAPFIRHKQFTGNINHSFDDKNELNDDTNNNTIRQSKSIERLTKRLSQAGILINNDHVLVAKLPRASPSVQNNSQQLQASPSPTLNNNNSYINHGYSVGENFDDPTCDLFGPRFSRITLTDIDVNGKGGYIDPCEGASQQVSLPSVYYTGGGDVDGDDDDSNNKHTGSTGDHLNDLKSKPQCKLNLQRTIIQVASDQTVKCYTTQGELQNEVTLQVKKAPNDHQTNAPSSLSSPAIPLQLNILASSSLQGDNFSKMKSQCHAYSSECTSDNDGQEGRVSVCACIDEDIEGEDEEEQEQQQQQHTASRASSSIESTHSSVAKEMYGEGFKRWSRGKAATPLEAAYHPALAEVSGRTFEPTTRTIWSVGDVKRGNSMSSSVRFNGSSPASSICGGSSSGKRESIVDTAGIRGLSYVRKPSVPKSVFLTPRPTRRLNLGAGGGGTGGGGGSGRRGSVMTTIFGEMGDRRFSQDLRSPYDLPRHLDYSNEKEETAKVIFFQVFIPFLVAGFGNVGAGLILDHVQFWPVFRASKELFILVASFLGFKGNLEMTLAARLATQANCGQLDSLMAQVQIGIGNVALIQAQATVVAFLAALIAISINYFKDFTFQFESSLFIMTTSLVTAAITGLFLSLLMIIVTVFSRKIGINPDNVSTLLAAFLGDISAVILLAGSAKLFYDYRYITWLQPTVCIAFFIILPVFLFIARKNKYTHDVVGTGWVPIIIAMFISSIAGLIFDLAVDKYETIAVLQPIINGVGANLVAVQASRISTYFHQRATLGSMPVDDEGKFYRICQSPIDAFIGKSKYTKDKVYVRISQHILRHHSDIVLIVVVVTLFLYFLLHNYTHLCNTQTDPNVRTARLLVGMSIVGNIIYFVTVRLIQSGKIFVTFPFISFYLTVGILQVVILLYMAHLVVPFLWSKKFDPDNSAIPGIMSCGDLLGTAFLTIAYVILEFMGDPNIYHSLHGFTAHIVIDEVVNVNTANANNVTFS